MAEEAAAIEEESGTEADHAAAAAEQDAAAPDAAAAGEYIEDAKDGDEVEDGKVDGEKKEEEEEEPDNPEEEEDEVYNVDLTVTVCICIPLASDEMLDAGTVEEEDAGAKKKATDQPRALQFYHVSYFLLPTDEEPVATDVVTYVQVSCRAYPKRSGCRACRGCHACRA